MNNNMIPATDKTISILMAIADAPASQATLSRTLGITMSTTYRILTTLQIHHWVKKNTQGIYSLDRGILPVTNGIQSEIRLLENARKQVQRIADEYQIACKLSIRNEMQQQTCFRAEPVGPVALTGQAGTMFPLIEGSVGAALMSNMTDAQIRETIRQTQADIPEKKDESIVLNRIKEIREHGTVLNILRNRWNIAAFSIPLKDAEGEVAAAITLVGSTADFAGKKRNEWEKILKQTVQNCNIKINTEITE